MKCLKKLIADQRGMILVLSLLILALLIGAGVGAIVSMQTDFRSSGNLKTGTQAFYNADAGVNHARQELQDSDSPNFDSIFTAADGTVIVSNSSFNGGTYSVTRQGSASNPSRVKVLSVGTALNNARVELEVWFRRDTGRPPTAVETNSDLKISGNPNIMGVCGAAHSNDDMQVTGNPGVQMADGLTASNKPGGVGSLPEGMDISGIPCVGSSDCSKPTGQQPAANRLDTAAKKDNYEAGHNSAAEVPIPKINPADYAPMVAGDTTNGYQCRVDGNFYQGGTCGPNGLCSGGTKVADPPGYRCKTNGTLEVDGGPGATRGIFYAEGEAWFLGSPGSSSSPLELTLIARDTISGRGNAFLKPFPSTNEDLKNIQLITGNDLDISGSGSFQGAILAHQQINIGGTPDIKGFIIAADGQPTWTGDPFPNASSGSSRVTGNDIYGNAKITYACDFGCKGPACPPETVGTASWAQKF